jgi:SAM-dependent methyltransferase
VIPNIARYQRIAPFYDLLDLPFERRRYRALRPMLFNDMSGRLLDAGVGTGRNCEFYPSQATVSGIDISPAMLARAHQRCPTLAAGGRLYQMDVTELRFPDCSFDAAVASFLFCVLPDQLPESGGSSASSPVAIRMTVTAAPITSAGRFSPRVRAACLGQQGASNVLSCFGVPRLGSKFVGLA